MANTADAPAADPALRHFPNLDEHRELILKIVNQSGPPIFLAERRIMADRFSDMARALNAHWSKWTIAYSFKTNYQVAESGALHALGAIAEVVSGHEYRLAKRRGGPGASRATSMIPTNCSGSRASRAR